MSSLWPSVDQHSESIEQSINQWLISKPVTRAGNETGLVAGALSASGQPLYWYGEIAGYYLSWLAWMAANNSERTEELRFLGLSVIDALKNQWDNGTPPATRIYPEDQVDWRNQCQFSFDLSMILRGLAMVKAALGIGSWDGAPIRDALLRMRVPQTGLLSHATKPNHTVPKRWSTSSGWFQTKTAFALRWFAQQFGDSDLEQVADELHGKAIEKLAEAQESYPPHPFLYGVEGHLGFCELKSRASAFPIACVLRSRPPRFIATQEIPDASMPLEMAGRMDVLAQWLRIAAVLPEGQTTLTGRNVMTRCEQLLERCFDPVAGPGQHPGQLTQPGVTWVAIFWSQVLASFRGQTSRASWII